MENPHTEALPRDRRPGYSAGYISDAETGAFHFGDWGKQEKLRCIFEFL
jgi:hypothetical protein